nr:AAA family ATPase [Bacillus cereus]
MSAQHLLIFNPPNNIKLGEKSREVVSDFQKYDKLGSDYDLVELFKSDFSNLVLALFEEKNERQRLYYEEKEERTESILDRTIKIWESLITHRQIVHNEEHSLEVKTHDGETYLFNQLSDGEKAIFYYIAHVLLAEEHSYILIDEPENHLHLSICIKLWDILEQVRFDCKFIYITHNLDFAVSRNEKNFYGTKIHTTI